MLGIDAGALRLPLCFAGGYGIRPYDARKEIGCFPYALRDGKDTTPLQACKHIHIVHPAQMLQHKIYSFAKLPNTLLTFPVGGCIFWLSIGYNINHQISLSAFHT